jgi:hypothetical protein
MGLSLSSSELVFLISFSLLALVGSYNIGGGGACLSVIFILVLLIVIYKPGIKLPDLQQPDIPHKPQKERSSYWSINFPSNQKVKSVERKVLSEEELMELNPEELDEYSSLLKNWFIEDVKKTLTPTFLRSPLGERKCAHENCEYGEFRSTGYCLEHKNKKFFDTFEVKTPGLGTDLFIAKQVAQSNHKGTAAIAGGSAWLGLSIYDTLLSLLPDRYELAWRGVARGVFITIIVWILIVVPGIAATHGCGDLPATECNRGAASIIVPILYLLSLFIMIPTGGIIGALFGLIYYESEEQKYLNQLTIRKKSSDIRSIQESNENDEDFHDLFHKNINSNPVKYEPNISKKRKKRCKYYFSSQQSVNIRCTNYQHDSNYCDEHNNIN